MNATITEVAKAAQVSIATVSRVFNKSGRVDPETRRRVMEAANALNYIPNALGRSLSTRRAEAIGLLLPDLYGEFFSEVIRGADQTARQNRYHLLLSSSHNSKEDIAAALHAMRGRVDGIIIMSPHIDAHTLNTNLPQGIPAMLLNCYLDGEAFDALNIDNFNGAYQLVKHLLGHGHTRIAIIKGTEQNIDAQERLRGYRKALEDAGAFIDRRYEIQGNFDEESGSHAVKEILSLTPRPTAVFASNDSMAIGALSALRAKGVDVPGELAIAGFDDIPVAEFLTPGLTTMRVHISTLGVKAVEELLCAITEKSTHKKKQSLIVPELVVRQSCGCRSADSSAHR